MQKILRFLCSRVVLVAAMLLLQIAVIILSVWKLSQYFLYVYISLFTLSIFALLYIINKRDNPSYKLAWIIPILTFPVLGGLFYICFGGKKVPKKMRRRGERIEQISSTLIRQNDETALALKQEDKNAYNQAKYIIDVARCPMYKNTYTQYLSPGEEKFEVMKRELEKAERFIFLEYFIIQEGVMWDSILEILERKVKQGVEVRVIYDDMGCVMTLPYKYSEKLRKAGIKCVVFNPFRPRLTALLNHRDHRKILVIDGHTAITGGINLADEYINQYKKYGYWKDASVLVKGEAVWNFTVMFLQMWCYGEKLESNWKKYRPMPHDIDNIHSPGYAIPYCDSPMDNDSIGETVYLNLINKAKDYIYIQTPYLIIDNELTVALCTAASCGVDVRIITPHIPDKWYVHMVTRANYPQLIEAGVKIYEFTPGFIHSKTFVVDGEYATVGTINLDYRSLYLHFECGLWMYKTQAVEELHRDYLKTLEQCELMSSENQKKRSGLYRLLQAILRVFSPLL